MLSFSTLTRGAVAVKEVSNPLNHQHNSEAPWRALQPLSDLPQSYLAWEMWLNQHCTTAVPHTGPSSRCLNYALFSCNLETRRTAIFFSTVIATSSFRSMNINFSLIFPPDSSQSFSRVSLSWPKEFSNGSNAFRQIFHRSPCKSRINSPLAC